MPIQRGAHIDPRFSKIESIVEQTAKDVSKIKKQNSTTLSLIDKIYNMFGELLSTISELKDSILNYLQN